jgi:hypothetical protein
MKLENLVSFVHLTSDPAGNQRPAMGTRTQFTVASGNRKCVSVWFRDGETHVFKVNPDTTIADLKSQIIQASFQYLDADNVVLLTQTQCYPNQDFAVRAENFFY